MHKHTALTLRLPEVEPGRTAWHTRAHTPDPTAPRSGARQDSASYTCTPLPTHCPLNPAAPRNRAEWGSAEACGWIPSPCAEAALGWERPLRSTPWAPPAHAAQPHSTSPCCHQPAEAQSQSGAQSRHPKLRSVAARRDPTPLRAGVQAAPHSRKAPSSPGLWAAATATP